MELQRALPGVEFLESAKPILKWAGGKVQLRDAIRRAMPKHFHRYAEPFLGGGALLFDLAIPGSLAGDSNPELMHFYTVVRDQPEELLGAVDRLPITEQDYYRVRAQAPALLGNVERAARFVYLNKTCYNGLHRVNRRGQFNTPFGGRTNVTILDAANLRRVSRILKVTELYCGDYSIVLGRLQAGDFVYLDPPYLPLGGYADFRRYTRHFFGAEDHVGLAKEFAALTERGILALLSNSSNPRIEELYAGYPCCRLKANRQINCRPEGRGPITELLIANYPLEDMELVP